MITPSVGISVGHAPPESTGEPAVRLVFYRDHNSVEIEQDTPRVDSRLFIVAPPPAPQGNPGDFLIANNHKPLSLPFVCYPIFLPLSTADYVGLEVIFVGIGRAADGSSSNYMNPKYQKIARQKITSADNLSLNYQWHAVNGALGPIVYFKSPPEYAAGRNIDSGGPSFVQMGTELAIAGVHRRGGNAGIPPTTAGDEKLQIA